MSDCNTWWSWWDWIAMVCLFGAWAGYAAYVKYYRKFKPCLGSVMEFYRYDWMMRLLGRDNRIADASFVSTLRASVSFFASTSILIIAGLITGIAASEEAISVLSSAPFVSASTQEFWEARIMFLLVVFIYAFFQFTWSLRLYNFSCILMGSAPLSWEISDKTEQKKLFAKKCSRILTLAAHHFNMGLRSYYFALATITWFVHPALMITSLFLVVGVLFHREFHSQVFHILSFTDLDEENVV